MRNAFAKEMTELAQERNDVCLLSGDIGNRMFDQYKKVAPSRFLNCGIAEANMMGVAAGMTIGGKVPFTGTFANFSTGRVYDQIRQSIAYSEKNVKICASHAGLTLGEDGATHQILEDIGMMKMLPNMTVVVPADYEQTRQATLAIADHHGPVYLRFGRPKVPVFIDAEAPFELGKIQKVISGADLTIAACGHLVWEAIQAAVELAKDGIHAEVLNVHTIKPLDEKTLIESAQKTGHVLVAEEHQRLGGLGSSVAQCLAANHPTAMDFVAVEDQFGESDTPAQLMQKYGLDAASIVRKSKALLGK